MHHSFLYFPLSARRKQRVRDTFSSLSLGTARFPIYVKILSGLIFNIKSPLAITVPRAETQGLRVVAHATIFRTLSFARLS